MLKYQLDMIFLNLNSMLMAMAISKHFGYSVLEQNKTAVGASYVLDNLLDLCKNLFSERIHLWNGLKITVILNIIYRYNFGGSFVCVHLEFFSDDDGEEKANAIRDAKAELFALWWLI